ncbi:hypothetical protein B566_EDAN010718 [Ephemera danica]|nr:hypothetical protein B566_EDAN010718 [Ephemera danica]
MSENMEENRRKRKASEGDSSKSSDDSVLDQKTSTQILNELFGAFELTLDTKAPSKKSKKEKKKKKEKHKHKHKEKDKDRDREKDKEKHKKRDHRKSSSDSRRISLADDDCLGLKIEVKKDKDSKKDDFRRESREESRRDSKEDSRRDHREGSKKEKDSENRKDKESKPSVENNSKPATKASSPEPKVCEPNAASNDENEVMGIEDKEMSPDLPSVAAKSEENDEPTEVFEIGAPKPPTGVLIGPSKGKIQIKSLKTSAVFEQTIREVEEEARKRAEKYEEGELTPSTCSQPAESTTPSLSDMELPPSAPTPPLPLPAFHLEDSSPEKPTEEKRSRHRSGKEDDCVAKLKAKLKSRSRSRDRRGKSGEGKRHKSRDRHGKDQTKERKRSRSRDRSSRDQRQRERRRSQGRGRETGTRDEEAESQIGQIAEKEGIGDGRERPEDDERIDKRKLLAIARRNAMYLLKEQQERMIQAGIITGDASTVAANPDGKGGKTVAELTEYCKQLVKSGSGSSDDDSDISLSDGEGPTESFIHHPFTLKDRPNAIILNIRNSTQLPTRSMQEKAAETSKMRSLQFPVSSGQQHRSSEWVPVSPKKDEPAAPAPASKAKPAEKQAQECQVTSEVSEVAAGKVLFKSSFTAVVTA